MAMRLVLASTSPRRADVLAAAGFQFTTVAVDVDERVADGEPPERYVRRMAAEKSEAACTGGRESGTGTGGRESLVVLGADTAVVIDGDILGKPRDDREAEQMLRRLAGRQHVVMTGISLRTGTLEMGRVESTTVHFAPMTADEVAWYAASGEGRDKAGAYAIQGLASRFVRRIEGSYTNVVGIPVAAVYELLRDLGVDMGVEPHAGPA